MNFLRKAVISYVEASSSLRTPIASSSRSISTSFFRGTASKPDTKFSEAGEEYGDEEDVYTSSFDEIAPSSVSHDIAPIENPTLTPAYFNKTPRERRLDELKKITSMKKLNQMLGAIKPAHYSLKDHELKVSFIRGSGNGGQAINKLSTCVSIIHLPTGIRVKAQPTRSQNDNRIAAMKILAEKLATLDPNSTRESREDILRARVALRKRRSMRKANKGYGNKPGVGLLSAPSEEDFDEDDEEGFEDEDEEEDEEEGTVEIVKPLSLREKPILSILDEKALKAADKEVREGLKKARKLERKEKKDVKEEKKKAKEQKAEAKAAAKKGKRS